MKRRLAMICCGLFVLFLADAEVRASGRRFPGAWRNPLRSTATAADSQYAPIEHQRYVPNRYDHFKYYQQWYPKYYGGLHSSVILRNAYPGNEARLRGYAW